LTQALGYKKTSICDITKNAKLAETEMELRERETLSPLFSLETLGES